MDKENFRGLLLSRFHESQVNFIIEALDKFITPQFTELKGGQVQPLVSLQLPELEGIIRDIIKQTEIYKILRTDCVTDEEIVININHTAMMIANYIRQLSS